MPFPSMDSGAAFCSSAMARGNALLRVTYQVYTCLTPAAPATPLNPFRAPEPLPTLNPSNVVPENGFPVVKGLISARNDQGQRLSFEQINKNEYVQRSSEMIE